VQQRASAVFPCAGGSGLVPRAAQCLEGRWARCRRQPTATHPRGRATTAAPGRISPSEGENAAWCSGHGPPTQADGRGPPPAADPARHVVLCGHRSVFSSPPGEANVSPPHIFPRTLLTLCNSYPRGTVRRLQEA
jgi:hypothetical protein